MNSELYKVVEKEQLHEMLTTFEACVKLPIQVIDAQGSLVDSRGHITHFCSRFKKYLPPYDSCSEIHAKAAKQAAKLGEAYIFSCHANLNHIVFPLISKSTFLASILVGPFLMDEADSILLLDINKKYSIPLEALLELYDEVGEIPVIQPSEATHISHLLYYMFSGLIADARQVYHLRQETLLQQAKINDSIQRYKNSEVMLPNGYPYEKEKDLLQKVKTGNLKDAKKTLNDLLGYVFFSEGNSLEVLKSRAVELASLLSRAAIEGGAATDAILKVNNQFIKTMAEVDSLEELCYKLQETVEVFTESMFNVKLTKNQDVIREAMQYMSQHYMNRLTLDEVAEYVHLSPSYFSALFKDICGSSFKEYLNLVRIEESKRLLANTEYSIMDIAIATGFADQNYFAKVFKKFTGLTPSEFR